jgi:hypothetical protein
MAAALPVWLHSKARQVKRLGITLEEEITGADMTFLLGSLAGGSLEEFALGGEPTALFQGISASPVDLQPISPNSLP